MLAVVEYEQGRPPDELVHDAVQCRRSGAISDPDRSCERHRDISFLVDGRQVHAPNAVFKLFQEVACDSRRAARLADPAWSDHGDELVLRDKRSHALDVGVAADQPRQLGGQVAA